MATPQLITTRMNASATRKKGKQTGRANAPSLLATLCLAGLLALAGMSEARAQMIGPRYEVNVRGVRMDCRSFRGEPVAIFLNPRLQNVGVAHRQYGGQPAIVINPTVTNRYSDIVAQWWFAHECAHHALPPMANNETNADCFGIRELRRVGLLHSSWQLQAFARELRSLPGSPMGHLPGRIRARNVVGCALN